MTTTDTTDTGATMDAIPFNYRKARMAFLAASYGCDNANALRVKSAFLLMSATVDAVCDEAIPKVSGYDATARQELRRSLWRSLLLGEPVMGTDICSDLLKTVRTVAFTLLTSAVGAVGASNAANAIKVAGTTPEHVPEPIYAVEPGDEDEDGDGDEDEDEDYCGDDADEDDDDQSGEDDDADEDDDQ